MAGIVNKVYFLPVLRRVSGVEVVGCEDGRRGFLQKPDKKKNTSVESAGILGALWQGKQGIVTQVTNTIQTSIEFHLCRK